VQRELQATMCVAIREGISLGQAGIDLSRGGSYNRGAATGYGAINASAGAAHGADG